MKILISTGGGDPKNYVNAVAAAGGEPCPAYLPGAHPAGYAGLVLAGGEDMDPPGTASPIGAPGGSTGPGTGRSCPCWMPFWGWGCRCWPSAGAAKWPTCGPVAT